MAKTSCKYISCFVLVFLGVTELAAQEQPLVWATNTKKITANIAATFGQHVETDALGNVYTVGQLWDGPIDFDPESSEFIMENEEGTGQDIWILKVDRDGDFVWAKQLEGLGSIHVSSFGIDDFENVYIAGSYKGSVDFDPGPEEFLLDAGLNKINHDNFFTVKLSPQGQFEWVKELEGDFSYARISVSANTGDLMIWGSYKGIVDLDPGAGEIILESVEGERFDRDKFLLGLNSQGEYQWHKNFPNAAEFFVSKSLMSREGKIYAVFYLYENYDLDLESEAGFVQADPESFTPFLLKMETNGSIDWIKRLGGETRLRPWQFELSDSMILIAGQAGNSGDVDSGPNIHNVDLGDDGGMVVMRVDLEGEIVWAKAIKGSGYTEMGDVALDADGNIYLTGSFEGRLDFDPGEQVFELDAGTEDNLSYDGFISKLDSEGNFLWAKQLESHIGVANGNAITVDRAGNLIAVGAYWGPADLDPGPGVIERIGRWDTFILKFGDSVVGLDISDHSFDTAISLYPNPTPGRFTLDLGESYQDLDLSLYNVLGQKVKDWEGEVFQRKSLEIPGPVGLYFLSVRSADGRSASLPVVKQ